MAQITKLIFPTSVYGQITDVFGTAVTQYANTNGVPLGSGLLLGQFARLIDGTEVRLLAANAGIAQFNSVIYVIGNSNDYTVQNTSALNTQEVTAFNDRAGSTALVANNYAWMTTRGLGTVNVAATITAPVPLATSATAGQLGAYTAGTSTTNPVWLLNTTTTAGPYPAKLTN